MAEPGPAPMTTDSTPALRSVDDVLEAANAMFTRLRHTRQAAADGEHLSLAASRASADYIQSFWPHVVRLVEADPRKLGLSVPAPAGAQHRTLEDVRRALPASNWASAGLLGDPLATSMLAPLRMMSEVLNAATASWAREFQAGPGRCPLEFTVDASRFVSLRALLPRRQGEPGLIGANAPTLVMGGTSTAITLCWNLLYQLPRAYREFAGAEPDRHTFEQLWVQTRELIFRIGSGSLSTFVAFASACSSQSGALLWDGARDLGLSTVAGRPVWTMNDALFQRFVGMIESMRESQQGHYIGCAALYARAEPLPLAPEFADHADGRQPTVFAELLRWLTAVARAEYFPQFEPSGGRGSECRPALRD